MIIDANCPANKIDSNTVGLAIADEYCPGQLPENPIWRQYEPNSFADFGAQTATTPRDPISQGRQNQKGVVTDVDASGGFNQDVTLANTVRLLQNFFFAAQRAKPTTVGLNTDATLITDIDPASGYAVATADVLGFLPGHLILVEGFEANANNGLKVVAGATATDLTVVGGGLIADAAPNAWGAIKAVGYEFAADELTFEVPVGELPRLVSTGRSFADFDLIPGEWIFIGGDAAANRFDSGTGFARIKTISDDTLVLDKATMPLVADAGAGKTIRLFFGDVIRNEPTPELILQRTVQLRRTLGSDADGVQSEYLTGATANQLTLNISSNSKLTADYTFVGMDSELRTGAEGVKPGLVVKVPTESAFNTSSNFARIKIARVNEENSNVTPLFAFATDLTLSINNGVTPLKALGVLGAFSHNVGNFGVSGSMTGYFASVDAVKAVRNNDTITLDIVAVKGNAGMVWDIPAMTLGGGRVQVEKDQPVMVPVDNSAFESEFGHTLLFQSFNYLPSVANS